MIKHLLLVTTLLSGATRALIAQNQEPPSMQSLIEEVHQLRLAVERMGSLMPRMQITMQRMQLQEQRVAELSRQLKAVRRELMAASAERARQAARVEELEGHVRDEQDPNRRKMLQEQISAVKSHLEQNPQIVQHLFAQEAEAVGTLRLEQSRLDELSERLNTLEHGLGGVK